MEAKALKFKELPGLSERQLSEHHDVLYQGYVKKLGEIRDRFDKVDVSTANPTFGDFRELKLEEGYALDAIILHELYFDNLGGSGMPSENMKARLEKDFGSFENWKKELAACGISARGWVILAEDSEGVLRHFIADMHNQGGIWGVKPILVLDVYEHAYFIDYGTKRAEYLVAFINNIDWNVVEARIDK